MTASSSSEEVLRRALDRERRARKDAERLLEERGRELFVASEQLRALNRGLERVIEQRTEEIRGANHRLRTLIQRLPVGVLVEDAGRRVLLANPLLCEMFSVPATPDALVGADCKEAGHRSATLFADPDGFLRTVEERIARGEPVAGERLQMRDGRELERDYIPVVSRGESHGHMWLYRDVTTQEQVARQLDEARQAAESANQEKTKFLAMMSHELRTPLSVVVGAAELMDTTRLDDDQSRLLRRLRLNASSMLHQITDLLDVSKLEAGEIRIETEEFDPVLLVEDVVETFASRAHEAGLEMVADVDLRLPPTLRGDPHRVRQIVTNLLTNAIKFTTHGHVVVRARCLENVGGTATVEYEVEDTGRGISTTDQPRIFERFYRVSRQGAPSIAGTGLGLAICHELARMMDGSLSVSSAVGQGSRFTLTCPHAVVTGERVAAPRRSHATLSGVSVALLGSSPVAADPVQRLLEGLGAKVFLHSPAQLDPAWFEGLDGVDVVLYDADGIGISEVGLAQVLSDHEATASSVWVRAFSRQPLDREAASRLGVRRQLAKPLRSTAIACALTEGTSEGGREEQPSGLVASGRGRRSSPDQPRPTVLLVDDDPDNREIVRWQLTDLDVAVETASDGRMALEKARLRPYDLIITDIGMPSVDGFAFARAYRTLEERTERRRTSIIALSAHAQSEHRNRCATVGIDAFLTKPCPVSVLAETISRWMSPEPVVLVVDDSPDLRALTGLRLNRIGGLVVEYAGSGEEALERFEHGLVSMVFLDLNLPGISGLETAAQLRVRPAWRSVPVIALTGETGQRSRDACRDAGCSDFLTKPVPEARLREVVQRYLG
ncbi:MAG: response regulator [Nannocystales bacterium]